MDETNQPQKKNGNISYLFEHNINLLKRTLYLGSVNVSVKGAESGIDASTTERFLKGIDFLVGDSKRSNEPIRVVLNTVGGDIMHGWAIYDAIRAAQCQVNIEVYGQAMSMGVVILQAGDKRLIHPHATIMIHDGTTSDRNIPLRACFNWADYLKQDLEERFKVFGERTLKEADFWRQLSHDTPYTAQQAYELGLVDEIIRPNKELPKPVQRNSPVEQTRLQAI